MTEAEILRVEAALGYPLPGEYRYFLLRYSEEVRRIKQAVPRWAALWITAEDIIHGNQNARRYAVGMTVDDEPWPEDYMVVGTNGGGDYWFVDRSGAMWGIGIWRHEGGGVEEQYESFEDYLAELRREMDGRN